jgi:hypothetical protein
MPQLNNTQAGGVRKGEGERSQLVVPSHGFIWLLMVLQVHKKYYGLFGVGTSSGLGFIHRHR